MLVRPVRLIKRLLKSTPTNTFERSLLANPVLHVKFQSLEIDKNITTFQTLVFSHEKCSLRKKNAVVDEFRVEAWSPISLILQAEIRESLLSSSSFLL